MRVYMYVVKIQFHMDVNSRDWFGSQTVPKLNGLWKILKMH